MITNYLHDTKRCKEVHEEGSVEILAQLVENKPVSSGNTSDVGLDEFLLGTSLHISYKYIL